jgi:hypothetical protein
MSDTEMSDQKKRFPIRQIVNDIFEGLTDLELMTKYRIVWASDLYRLFNGLVMKGLVTKDQIKNRRPERQKIESKREESDRKQVVQEMAANLNARVASRNQLFGSIEIYDMTTHPGSYGIKLKDITESGLMVAPIEIARNDVREFLIKPTHLEDVRPISLVAECRWTDGIRAGLKITSISSFNMKQLQELIRLFSFQS